MQIGFACAASSEAHCCQITVSWADSIGCRLTVSYVEGYLSCICAYSTHRRIREHVAHVLQVILEECQDAARHNFGDSAEQMYLCCTMLFQIKISSGFLCCDINRSTTPPFSSCCILCCILMS